MYKWRWTQVSVKILIMDYSRINTLHTTTAQNIWTCSIKVLSVSRTTGPILGLFVLICLYFSWWFHLWRWHFQIVILFFLNVLTLSSAFATSCRELKGKYDSLTNYTEFTVLLLDLFSTVFKRSTHWIIKHFQWHILKSSLVAFS